MKRLGLLVIFGILLILPFVLAKPDLIVNGVQASVEKGKYDVEDNYQKPDLLRLKIDIKNVGDEPVLNNFAVCIKQDSDYCTNVGVVQIRGQVEAQWSLSQKFRMWACKILGICPIKVGDEYIFPIKPGSTREYKTSLSIDSKPEPYNLIIAVDQDISKEGRPQIEGLIRPDYRNVIDESNEDNNEYPLTIGGRA